MQCYTLDFLLELPTCSSCYFLFCLEQSDKLLMPSSALASGTSNMLLVLHFRLCLGPAQEALDATLINFPWNSQPALDATLLLSLGTFWRALASNTLFMLSKVSPGEVRCSLFARLLVPTHMDSTLVTCLGLFQHDLDARVLTRSYHIKNALGATFFD